MNSYVSDKLVQDLMILARQIAAQVWRRAPSSIEHDELVSLGYLGLVKAASDWPAYCERNGYSPERIEFFTPYAERRIRGAILDSLRKSDFVPRSTREKIKALQAAGHDAGATESQLAARTGLSAAAVQTALVGLASRPVSLDGDSGVPDISSADQDDGSVESLLGQFTCAVGSLAPAQQVVLALHYFLGLELQQVASYLKITESRASHLHTEAVLSVHSAMLDAATALAS